MKSFYWLEKGQELKNWSHVAYTVPSDLAPANLSILIPFILLLLFSV